MNLYNVTKIAAIGSRTLLLIIGSDKVPMVSVYDEHTDQTLMRMTEFTVENLKYAIVVLEKGEAECQLNG
jgi:hypothetical protein